MTRSLLAFCMAALMAAPVSASEVRPPPRHTRPLFLAGGLLMLTGAGVRFWAEGEEQRAKTMQSAGAAKRTLELAHTSAATGNMAFALGGVSIVYGILMLFLPGTSVTGQDATFHF